MTSKASTKRPNYAAVPAAVYFLYGRFEGRDDALLYIGVTRDIYARFRYHKHQKEWWPDVQRHEECWFDKRDKAEAFEHEQLRLHRPPRNPRIPGEPYNGRVVSPYRLRAVQLHDDAWGPAILLAASQKTTIALVLDAALRDYVARHSAA